MQQRPRRQGQSGFSAIEALLVALIVAALAGTGLVIYQHHKGTKTTTATSESQTTTQPQSTATTQYLTITEWGVKIPLTAAIKDAYYSPATGSSNGPDGQPNTLLLGLKSLDSSGCAATNLTALAQIFRALPTEKDGVTIGNYFYAYGGINNNGTCKAPQAILHAIDTAFAAAVKAIVPATQYLTITEWGVRVPYSGGLKLSYTMSSDGRSATFSSEQLSAVSNDCIGGGGAILRWASTDQVSEGPPDANTPTAAAAFAGKDPSTVPYAYIGNYYFTFAHAQSVCGDINTTATLQSQTNDAVKALVTNLQAIPN